MDEYLHLFQSSSWWATPTLGDLVRRARARAGVREDNDPDPDTWLSHCNDAREELMQDLSPVGGLVNVDQITLSVTGVGIYDVSAYGFLTVDRVGYGGDAGSAWLPWVPAESAFGVAEGRTNPVGAYRAGPCAFGLAPSLDAGLVVVQGRRFPRPMAGDSDTIGVMRQATEAIAVKAAAFYMEAHIFDADFQRLIPIRRADYDRLVLRLKGDLLRLFPRSGGYTLAQAVTNAPVTDPASAIAVAEAAKAPAAPAVSIVTAHTEAMAGGETSAVISLTSPVDAASVSGVLCYSTQMGTLTDYAVAANRYSITVTLGTNPDGDQIAFAAGDVVYATYATLA